MKYQIQDKSGLLAILTKDYPLLAERIAADKTGNVAAVALYAATNGKDAILTALREQVTGDFAKLVVADPLGRDQEHTFDMGHGDPMTAYQVIVGAAVQPVDMPSPGDMAH